jgi:hypothetical protein
MSVGHNDSPGGFSYLGATLTLVGQLIVLPAWLGDGLRTLLAALGATVVGILGATVQRGMRDWFEVRANVKAERRARLKAEAALAKVEADNDELRSHLHLPPLTDADTQATETTGDWTPPKGV